MKMKIFGKIILTLTVLSLLLTGCVSKDDAVKEQKINDSQVEEVNKDKNTDNNGKNKNEESADRGVDLGKEGNINFDEVDIILDNAEYFENLHQVIENFKITLDAVNVHMDKAIDNPELLFDEQWVDDYEYFFYLITLSIMLLDKMDNDGLVPDDMVEIHNKTREALVLMEKAGKKTVEAFRAEGGIDWNKYDEGAKLMTDSQKAINELNELIRDAVDKNR